MIQSLRKEKGGYALLYIMVVVMVLCAISMMICTVALRNLQSQEASVRRMQDLYAAEGEIEKITALAGNIDNLGAKKSGDGVYHDAEVAYEEATGLSLDEIDPKEEDGHHYYTAQIDKVSNTVKVTAELNVDLEIVVSDEPVSPESKEKKSVYTINSVSVTFTSYTIENTGGGS